MWCMVHTAWRECRVRSRCGGGGRVCVCVYVYARAHMCMWWVLMDTGGGNPPHSGMTNPPPHLSSPCSSVVHDQAQWFVAIITGQPHQALLDNPRRQPQALGHTAQQGCLASRRVAKDVLLQHYQCTGVRVKHDNYCTHSCSLVGGAIALKELDAVKSSHQYLFQTVTQVKGNTHTHTHTHTHIPSQR